MLRKRVFAVAGAVIGLAMTGTVSTTISASATAAAPETSDVRPLGVPPDCVWHRVHNPPGYVRVHNDCSTTKRVAVIISWGPDGTCQSIPAGDHHDWWLLILRVDRLEAC
jgi:hypothetical protein